MIGLRVGSLAPQHRPQVEAIVQAAGVFSDDEVAVALELFDAATGVRQTGHAKWAPSRSPFSNSPAPDYEFVGVFDADNTPIGFACYGPTPATDGTFDLYWIAVHPVAQRTGAGSALMAEVERRLTDRARLLVVETSSRADYAPTRRFYQKRGYEPTAEVRDFYARGDHRLILTKALTAAAEPKAESPL